jgi:hypothetical protein
MVLSCSKGTLLPNERQTGKCSLYRQCKDTVLNIIPVDYVAKVIVNTFVKEMSEQLNIVNKKSFNMVKWITANYEGSRIH